MIPHQLARRPETKKPAAPPLVIDEGITSSSSGPVDGNRRSADVEDHNKSEETDIIPMTTATAFTPASSSTGEAANFPEGEEARPAEARLAPAHLDAEQTEDVADNSHVERPDSPATGEQAGKERTPEVDSTEAQTASSVSNHPTTTSVYRFDPSRDEFVSHPNGISAVNLSNAPSDDSRPSSQHTGEMNGQPFSIQSPNGYSTYGGVGFRPSTGSPSLSGGAQQYPYSPTAPYTLANGSGTFSSPSIDAPPYNHNSSWSQPPHIPQAQHHQTHGSLDAFNGINQTPRSASQASMHNDVFQPTYAPQMPIFHTQPSAYQSASQHIQMPENRQNHVFASNEYNTAYRPEASGLARYLEHNLGKAEFADTTIYIQDKNGGTLQSLDAHAVILAQSSELRSLLRGPMQSSNSGRRELHILPTVYFSHVGAFVDVIRSLYHQRVLDDVALWRRSTGEARRSDHPSHSGPRSDDTLEYILSYMATSCRLGLPYLANSASYLVYKYLYWTKLDLALRFALQGGLNPSWWFHACESQRLDPALAHAVGKSRPIYEPFAEPILCQVTDFITSNMPQDIEFDPTATQLAGTQRIPAALLQSSAASHAPKGSISNPRLKTLRLGEFPVDGTQPRVIVSSILLSLPFPVLKALLEHPVLEGRLGRDMVSKLMHAVIAEREQRRHQALALSRQQPALLQQDVLTHLQRQTLAIKEMVTETTGAVNGVISGPQHTRARLSFSYDPDVSLNTVAANGT